MRVPAVLILSVSIVLAAVILRPVLHQRPVEMPADGPILSLAAYFENEWIVFDPATQSTTTGRIEWSDERVEQVVEVASDIDAEMGEQLQALWDDDPDGFQRSVEATGQRLLSLVRLKQEHNDLYRLRVRELGEDIRISRLARDLRNAKAGGEQAEVERLEEALKFQLRFQLALKIKDRADYLCILQGHFDDLYAEIDRAATEFNETIDRRYGELTVMPSASP